jgi:p-aminobenzoyl-glutamate transporter AbgT
MKLGQNKTPLMWILMAVLLFIIVYDAWACKHKETHDTISKIVTKSSEKYLIIPVICGMLIAHFFWSQHLTNDTNENI